jgi:HPt (histidine-containing phosphotransfer) domain-containing protein
MKGDREECISAGMDDYVSKPFRANDLYQVISRLIDHQGDRETEQPLDAAAMKDDDVFDVARLLENSMDSMEIAQEVAALVLEGCPGLMSSLRNAIARQDCAAVFEFAHKLKGSLGACHVGPAHAVVSRLEMMGREKKLEEAARVFEELEREMERLMPALREFAGDLSVSR